MSSYHLKEKPSGSNANILAEKWMYCSALNESGKITNNGAIKKKKPNHKKLNKCNAKFYNLEVCDLVKP